MPLISKMLIRDGCIKEEFKVKKDNVQEKRHNSSSHRQRRKSPDPSRVLGKMHALLDKSFGCPLRYELYSRSGPGINIFYRRKSARRALSLVRCEKILHKHSQFYKRRKIGMHVQWSYTRKVQEQFLRRFTRNRHRSIRH